MCLLANLDVRDLLYAKTVLFQDVGKSAIVVMVVPTICAARHRYSPCYILLHLILIVYLFPSQSNDVVSEVFVQIGDAGDNPLCYILEKVDFLSGRIHFRLIQLYRVCLSAGYPKIVMVFAAVLVSS